MYTMTPAAFDYHRPTSVDEALSLLAADEGTRPLAGGHSLIPAMKIRLATPSALVDLGGIPGLDGIERDGDELVIGALATHAAVASSAVAHETCPMLAEAAGLIGDRQVRNRGTIGGSIAHADPGADYPTVTTALGATIVTASKSGGRSIPAEDVFIDVFTTALEPGELITSIRIPATPAGTGAAYVKHAHPASRLRRRRRRRGDRGRGRHMLERAPGRRRRHARAGRRRDRRADRTGAVGRRDRRGRRPRA